MYITGVIQHQRPNTIGTTLTVTEFQPCHLEGISGRGEADKGHRPLS